MQKKDDKVGNKIAQKYERKRKNESHKKNRNRFAKNSSNGFMLMRENKGCLITSD